MNSRIMVIGILALLLFSSFAVGLGSGNAKGNVIKKMSDGGVKGYTTHGVIRINNDMDFSNQASQEGWQGDGSQSNPYIISGYDIDAHGAGDALYIGNTTVYFVVENCYLHNASHHSDPYFEGDGIMLYNVTNGAITGVNATDNRNGVNLYLSRNDIIGNNNYSYNTIYGIEIKSSQGNILFNNTMIKDDIIIKGWLLEDYITNKIYINNTVNGKPIYFLKNITGEKVPAGAGEIIIANCTSLIIENQTLNYGSLGIEIAYSFNITLINNTVSNQNMFGCYIYSSMNNKLLNNTFSHSWVGVYIYLLNNTIIRNNSCTGNGNPPSFTGGGIYIKMSNNNTLLHNNCSGNVGWDIYLESSNNNTISNNNCSNAVKDSIYLDSSNKNVISNNNCSNSDTGIVLDSSNKNVISNNSCIGNTWGFSGMYLKLSNNNTILNNNCSDNPEAGIILYSSGHNIIKNNTFSRNADPYSSDGKGIIIESSSSNNIIINNLISYNYAYGIYIEAGSFNIIYKNFLYYNNGAGSTYNYNHIQAYDGGSNNYWNATTGIGNYWYDWANNNDTNDQNHDGIVDWPYKIDGSARAKDFYPLKNASLNNVLSHPMNLTARAGNGYVNLTWDPPVYGKDTVTQYNIYRNGVLIKIKTVSGNQLYYNDTSVQNGQTYTYYVTANNSVGESDKSNEVQATPGGTVPEFSTGIWLFIVILISLFGVIRFRKSS